MQIPGDILMSRDAPRCMQIPASCNGKVHRDRATSQASRMSLVGNSFDEVNDSKPSKRGQKNIVVLVIVTAAFRAIRVN